MKSILFKFLPLAAVSTTALLLVNCASTPPTAKFSQNISTENRIGAADSVKTEVKAAGLVDMLDIEKTRLAQRIEQQIAAKKGSLPQTKGRKIQVDLTITRYEKGNAFARATLAGLGQIHLDGTAKVLVLPAKQPIGEFEVKKTFAWGGIYGGIMTMEDIERSFAEGVAAAVTGTKENSKR